MRKFNNRGITLIALVITIVILLILAGVTLNAVLGNNGILEKSKLAKTKTEISNIKEEIQTDILAKQTEKDGDISNNDLEKILKTYGTLTNEEELMDRTLTTTKGNHDIKVSDLFKGTTSEYEEGTDIPDDTHIYISTENELKAFRDKVNSGEDLFEGKNVILKNNIPLTENWTPIGTTEYKFKGTFEGRNKSIINLDSPLFNYNLGNISNLITEGGEILNGSINGNIASIVIYNDGTITNCINKNNIQTTNVTVANAGGITSVNNGTIQNSANLGNIKGLENCGGISAINYNTVKMSYNTGNITIVAGDAYYSSAGGISAKGMGNINKCYNTGNIRNESSAQNVRSAGILGSYEDKGSINGVINYVYNTGTIYSNKNSIYATAAGIVGHMSNNDLNYCYNIGTIEPASRRGEIYGIGSCGANTYGSTITPEDMLEGLGTEFEADTGNKNNGYPILKGLSYTNN